MKILQAHNFYQFPGGEDQVLGAEHATLTAHGDTVEQLIVRNDALDAMTGLEAGLRTVWNPQTSSAFAAHLEKSRPDVLHVHNSFPLLSPSLFYAAARQRVPVVQTLHNFRLVCPASTLYREGKICETCLGKSVPYPAAIHACYRDSHLASAALAAMLALHRTAGTWQTKIDTYIAPSHFARQKLIEGGLPAAKIVVKPNFLAADPSPGDGHGEFALFLGRLAEVKGIRTLLAAWQDLPGIPLHIAGDGPLRPLVLEAAERTPQISFLGQLDRAQALAELQSAAFLVLPSEWYEALPMTIVEAMACGTPVLASDLGSLQELVIPDENGFRFPPADPSALRDLIRHLVCRPQLLLSLRSRCRRIFEVSYSAEQNYLQLKDIYTQAMTRYAHH